MTTEELRRLLEMAARACGIQVDERGPFTEVPCMQSEFGKGNWIESSRRAWIPDIDDGDSARMRSALGIGVAWEPDPSGEIQSLSHVHCMCWRIPHGRSQRIADHNGDRNAALRLCALKVAAMIGEGME